MCALCASSMSLARCWAYRFDLVGKIWVVFRATCRYMRVSRSLRSLAALSADFESLARLRNCNIWGACFDLLAAVRQACPSFSAVCRFCRIHTAGFDQVRGVSVGLAHEFGNITGMAYETQQHFSLSTVTNAGHLVRSCFTVELQRL